MFVSTRVKKSGTTDYHALDCCVRPKMLCIFSFSQVFKLFHLFEALQLSMQFQCIFNTSLFNAKFKQTFVFENIVGKGKYASNKQLHLIQQVFLMFQTQISSCGHYVNVVCNFLAHLSTMCSW